MQGLIRKRLRVQAGWLLHQLRGWIQGMRGNFPSQNHQLFHFIFVIISESPPPPKKIQWTWSKLSVEKETIYYECKGCCSRRERGSRQIVVTSVTWNARLDPKFKWEIFHPKKYHLFHFIVFKSSPFQNIECSRLELV